MKTIGVTMMARGHRALQRDFTNIMQSACGFGLFAAAVDGRQPDRQACGHAQRLPNVIRQSSANQGESMVSLIMKQE